MITFIDLTFDPEGDDAASLVARLQRIPGVSSVMGEHDLVFHWRTKEDFDRLIRGIHDGLKGTAATYRVFTVEDSYQSRDPVPWIGALEAEPPHHPAVQQD